MTDLLLSIVIPVVNEQLRLRETIFQIVRWCEANLRGRYEILIVENGSTDDTLDVATSMQLTYRPVSAFHIDERSKAQAVRFGMLKAAGEFIYMCDCDLSVRIEELSQFLAAQKKGGYDVIIGSREHLASHVDTSFKRWFIGRIFQAFVKIFTGLQFSDTQCGFKLFSRSAAKKIFRESVCNSLAFDVEALYLADQLGFYVDEIPVTFVHDPDSRVRLVTDSWSMFLDISRVRKLHSAMIQSYKKNKLLA